MNQHPPIFEWFWRAHVLPRRITALQGNTRRSSILSPVAAAADGEIERLKRWGVHWSWASCDPWQREHWWQAEQQDPTDREHSKRVMAAVSRRWRD